VSTAQQKVTLSHPSIGSAIYVYGSADDGIRYTWSINDGKSTDGKPNGNLLIAAENLKLDPFYYSSFSLEIKVAQFAPGARFQFGKADVVVGTGMTG